MEEERLFDYLDEIAIEIAEGGCPERYTVLSTGEKLYVAFAASRGELIEAEVTTLVRGLDRIGDSWMKVLLERWRYRPPAKLIAATRRQVALDER